MAEKNFEILINSETAIRVYRNTVSGRLVTFAISTFKSNHEPKFGSWLTAMGAEVALHRGNGIKFRLRNGSPCG